jgi:hypothetical protein
MSLKETLRLKREAKQAAKVAAFDLPMATNPQCRFFHDLFSKVRKVCIDGIGGVSVVDATTWMQWRSLLITCRFVLAETGQRRDLTSLHNVLTRAGNQAELAPRDLELLLAESTALYRDAIQQPMRVWQIADIDTQLYAHLHKFEVRGL